MATPEGKVKAKLKKALDAAFPGHYRFMPVQTGYGAKTLDFLLCIHGLFVAIETKAPGKAMTGLQHSTYQDIYDAGGLAYVVDSEETADSVIANIILAVEFRSARDRRIKTNV
jgi:hypothetical protein